MKNVLLGMVSCLFLATSVHGLDEAIKNNDLATVKADLQERRVSADKVLDRAVFHNNLEAAKVAIQAGADVNRKKDFPYLWWSVDNRNVEMVRLLLDQPGINVELPDVYGNSPLATAITGLSNLYGGYEEEQKEYYQIIGLLIRKGADLNAHYKRTYSDEYATSPRNRLIGYLHASDQVKIQEFLDECVNSISNF